MKQQTAFLSGFILLIISMVFIARQPIQQTLFNLTGEETLLPQISGGLQYALTRLQPPLQTADNVPIQHVGMNPFGVNTFLQNEVESQKRDKAMRLISEAGITWIRQEFPWQDLEIHGKGDFEDRRHKPYQSAWAKYDNIVELAEKYHLNIMARLSTPPAWSRTLTDTVGTFAPPDNFNDYGDFVEAVARRYQGRIAAYQIWNEPNIYPEWGEYPISAEKYTELLKIGYTRVKVADSKAIVVMGALASTIELDRQRRYSNGIPTSPGGLSDVLFLQQLYNAGAAPYFDVLAMQGYGLWSGPTDRRMQPRVLNFSRPLYVRDVMVRNGDAHKAIWLSELGWNAVPPESGLPPVYGQVTLTQQARYTAMAYQRMQQEWPWLGVGFYWFFKQADDREKNSNSQYYFRLVEPDFTLLPVYEALKVQAHQPPIMAQGWHQPNHWAIDYHGQWQRVERETAPLGAVMQSSQVGDSVAFTFIGRRLELAGKFEENGRLAVQIDQQSPVEISVGKNINDRVTVVQSSYLYPQKYQVKLEVTSGQIIIEGFVVNQN